MQDGLSLPEWRGNTKNMDAQAAVLWGQVMTAVQLSGYNLVPPPGARGASKDWVRDGVRMQRWVVVSVGARYLPHAGCFDPGMHFVASLKTDALQKHLQRTTLAPSLTGLHASACSFVSPDIGTHDMIVYTFHCNTWPIYFVPCTKDALFRSFAACFACFCPMFM